MKKVADLKKYLKDQQLSPEELAPRVRISNMTLRRLLKRDDSSPIPEKYRLQLETLTINSLSAGSLRDYLQRQAELEPWRTEKAWATALKQKFEKEKVEPTIREQAQDVLKQAFKPQNRAFQAVAIGALIYFVNPFDLIPDFTGALGMVDDLGVLSFAASFFRKKAAKD